MPKTFKQIVFLAIFLGSFLVYENAFAADLYVAQSAAGGADATSCANAKAISYLSGSWSGIVSAGDTVHLCGTLTTALTTGGSGTSGSPITILFEDGAKFSAATWTNNTARIYLSSKSYITIDGGTDGTIEATANGHGLANGNDLIGIWMTGSSNTVVKNLSVLNLYVRASGDTDDTHIGSAGVYYESIGNDNAVQDCVFTYMQAAISGYFQGTTKSNLTVTGNTFDYVADGMAFGDGNENSSFNNVTFSYNTADHGNTWNTAANSIHIDQAIHLWAANGGTSSINGIYYYGNTSGPNVGANCSSHIRIEGVISSPMDIYNNLFLSANGQSCGDGITVTHGGATVYNNTFIGNDGTNGFYTTAGDAFVLMNNIFYDFGSGSGHAIYDGGTPSSITSDYNVIYSGINDFSEIEGSHSATAQPSLDVNYVPNSGDTVAKDEGIDLSAYFTADLLGNTRTGAWDIGAYEYVSDDAVPPAAPSGLSVQ